MLCGYFRQFGAIERVQILPERLKFTDILPTLGTSSGFVHNFRNGRKYFAYVTYVNCLGAYDALNKDTHEIQNHKLIVEQAFSWHQPGTEDLPVTAIPEVQKELFKHMDQTLNDDCIIKIMSFLNLYELVNMAKYNQRFLLLAQQQRTLKIIPDIDMDEAWTLMRLRYVLRLQGFGQSVKNLTISMKVFRTVQKNSIFERLVQYIGPQLTSLTLKSFNVTSDQFDQLKPLLQQLTFLDIDLIYEFSYDRFNDKWPNLETLRIRSAGSIQLVKDAVKTICPKLTSLQIITSYKLHENLFDTIATNYNGLNELVIIMLDDYYSELTHTITSTDFQNLSNLQYLRKLHLSIGRTYFNEVVIETIAEMITLHHLTLDITNYRGNDTQLSLSDRSLTLLVRGLRNLKEFRLSGLQMTSERIIQIVQNLSQLQKFGIHNCNYSVNINVINDIALMRARQQIERNELIIRNLSQTQPLIMIVDEFIDRDNELNAVGFDLSLCVLVQKWFDNKSCRFTEAVGSRNNKLFDYEENNQSQYN